MPTPAFPLRIHDERLRQLTRDVAGRLGLSQNEFIERAVEREVIVQGAMLRDDLRAAADRLATLTAEQYQRIVDRSAEQFVDGEAARDPLQPRATSGQAPRPSVRDTLSRAPAFGPHADQVSTRRALERG